MMSSRSTILLLFTVFLVTACRKEDEQPTQVDVVMMIDHAFTGKAILPVFAHLQSMQLGPGRWTPTGNMDCVELDSISGDTLAFPTGGPVTLHLRFLSPGCVGLDGTERGGIVHVSYDSIADGGARISDMYTTDLTAGGIRVRFGATVTTLGPTSSTLLLDSSYMHAFGDWSERLRGTITYSLQNAPFDSVPEDDHYTVQSDLLGMDRNGRSYGAISTESVGIAMECAWITGGVETFVVDDAIERRLVHGAGCDGQVELHANENVFGLTIP